MCCSLRMFLPFIKHLPYSTIWETLTEIFQPQSSVHSNKWFFTLTFLPLVIPTKGALLFLYRAVLFKWEFFIQMRDAISRPALDIEKSYFRINVLFFCENDLSFYYMKLYTPSIPLIEGFWTSFAPPFCSLTRRAKKSMASGAEMGCACFAPALIWMITEIRKDSA